MAKERRSNKWAFLMYEESVPDNYMEILEGLHVPLYLVHGMTKIFILKQAKLKNLTSMAPFTLIH